MDPHKHLDLCDLPGEEWMDVYGYDGIYQASNLGRVKALPREVRCGNNYRTTRERILRQGWNGNGYWHVVFCVDREKRTVHVARAVWDAFNGGPPPAGKVVMHRDKDQTNDSLSNLEAVTVLESNTQNYAMGVSVFQDNLAAYNKEQTAKLDAELVASPTSRICRVCKRELPNAVFVRSRSESMKRICLDCRLVKRGVVDVGRQRNADELFQQGLRRCNPCGRVLSLTNFGPCVTCPGGHAHRCRDCVRATAIAIRKAEGFPTEGRNRSEA